MKDHNLSANVVSAEQGPHAENLRAQRPKEAHRGVSSEPGADELATALAMMHATLESTTDAILVTDEAITSGNSTRSTSSFGEFRLT